MRSTSPRVDYTPDARTLQEVADYTVYVPGELPDGWVPTSSRIDAEEDEEEPVTWTVGFATPEDLHARFSMSDADPERFIAETTEQGAPDGESGIGGEAWKRYTDREEPQRSLVRREDGVTLVVTGSAGYAELETLAGSLEPRG